MVTADSSADTPQEKEVILAKLTIDQLGIGVKCWVEKNGEERKAELLSIQTRKGTKYFYVHYEDFNKRLDEWVKADRLNLDKEVELPVPEKPAAPKKSAEGGSGGGSGAGGSGSGSGGGNNDKSKIPKNQKKRAARDSIASTPDAANTPGPAKANKRARFAGKENEGGVESRDGSVPAEPTPKSDAGGAGAGATAPTGVGAEGGATGGDIDVVETPNGAVVAPQTDPAKGGDAEPANFSKEKEIEKLRTSGSMTQSAHEVARVRNLTKLRIGKHEVETWYFSPYPVEFTEEEVVYICEFCLSYFGEARQYERHRTKCELFHPPGNEIYRDEHISFFEIDGRRQRTWCRNLCLLSKCFLDHKTLYYDVDPFLFYCMTIRDGYGHHLVGYFSKEKESAENYNVACILTLPQHQRTGFGRLLIAFSYELSKRENKLGSPEKPLSDLGLLGYRAFWQETIVELLLELKDSKGEISVDEIASKLAMTTNDVVHTLQNLNMIKYYKGQYVICLTDGVLAQREKLLEKQKLKGKRSIDPSKLVWKPPVFSAQSKTWNW